MNYTPAICSRLTELVSISLRPKYLLNRFTLTPACSMNAIEVGKLVCEINLLIKQYSHLRYIRSEIDLKNSYNVIGHRIMVRSDNAAKVRSAVKLWLSSVHTYVANIAKATC